VDCRILKAEEYAEFVLADLQIDIANHECVIAVRFLNRS